MGVVEKSAVKTTSLSVSVPSELFLVLREDESQFVSNMKKFTALKLFQNNKLSVGQCAELANMPEEDFIYFLNENNVSIFDYLTETELHEELMHVAKEDAFFGDS